MIKDFKTLFNSNKKKNLKKNLKQRCSNIMEKDRYVLWDYDIPSKQIHYSSLLEKQLGYEDNELKSHFWKQITYNEDVPKIKDVLKNPVNVKLLEVRIKCQDGSYKWVRSNIKTIFKDEYTPLRIIAYKLKPIHKIRTVF